MFPPRYWLLEIINRPCYEQFNIGTISFDISMHTVEGKMRTLLDERFMFMTGWDVNTYAVFLD